MCHYLRIEFIKSLLGMSFHIETEKWFIRTRSKVVPRAITVGHSESIQQITLFQLIDFFEFFDRSLWVSYLKIGLLKRNIVLILLFYFTEFFSSLCKSCEDDHCCHNPTIHIVVISEKVVCRMFSSIYHTRISHHMFTNIDMTHHL